MYALSDYDYDLPEDRIAQQPCGSRSQSRLLHVDRSRDRTGDGRFCDIKDLLRPDDLLVVNNTRVIKARLYGRKETGGKVEILIIDYPAGLVSLEKTGFFQCDCLVRASRRPRAGSRIFLEQGVEARVVALKGLYCEIRFLNGAGFIPFLAQSGNLPLPPYIKRKAGGNLDSDLTDYQTVYASSEGAVAAPTAGLHFTKDLMTALEKKGIEFAPVTLHVGYGTFVPVKVADIRAHDIHSESYHIPPESAARINAARAEGRRIIAVGTTSVRTLEYAAGPAPYRLRNLEGVCDLFIYPGYEFKMVDAMITNFHLPQSTLLMLVSAFYDREKMLDIYRRAIENQYRFFSYGDAMFIE